MQATYDELILLRDRMGFQALPAVWILHHVAVASFEGDRLVLHESGGRSRYLDSVVRLGVRAFDWGSEDDLDRLWAPIADELAS